MLETNLKNDWNILLKKEFKKSYFLKIKKILKEEKSKGKIIYPEEKDIFLAYNLTPFDKVKVIIIGQDPYHGARQAHGLCFSILPGNKQPPSLKNIFKELNEDLGININKNKNGYLQKRAEEGVLMINSILTVRKGEPMSHSKIGWDIFTNETIKILSDQKKGLIFVLWGSSAKEKKSIIDTNRHYILESTHPSPFSANKGFFGSKPFSKINNILKLQGKKEINWQI